MTASVLECLYKSFGWTLINSEYIHLSSFFLTRTPGYLRAVRHIEFNPKSFVDNVQISKWQPQ